MTRTSALMPAARHSPGQLGAVAILALAAALPLTSTAARAAPPAPAAGAPRGTAAAPSRPAGTGQDGDAGSRSVAARARMNECGHQWNNMKRAGTASGTWKDFSRNCLAQK